MLKFQLVNLILKIESQKSYFTLLLKKKLSFHERVSKFMQKSIEADFFFQVDKSMLLLESSLLYQRLKGRLT